MKCGQFCHYNNNYLKDQLTSINVKNIKKTLEKIFFLM